MLDVITAIRTRRAEIADMVAALTAEDQELASTEQVLARLAGESALARAKGSSSRGRTERVKAEPSERGPNESARTLRRPRSQREFVLETLSRSDEPWLRGVDIIAQVKARWGEVIPEMSLRPLLTNLKKTRHITRHGRFVALRERAHEAKPALKDTRRT